MIPAALLCVMVSGCADREPVGPELPRVAPISNRGAELAPFNKFFVAWSQGHSSSPIQTQTFTVDTRQERQYAAFEVHQNVLSFASANPGRLYINGDEPDQYCIAPALYADVYHDFVIAVRSADPTARVSPAGFAEPNGKCCPDPADASCALRMHSVSYADQFYNAYVQRYGKAPPVNEWRFHDFGLSFAVGDVDGWWARVDKAAAWSVSHGANMVLGAWGFLGWRESDAAYQEHMKQGIGRLSNDSRINGAAYWAHEFWAGEAHYLVNGDGSLTPEGQTYANPLTDIPTGVELEGSANGNAKLRWSNTTSAWGAEAEFWLQAPGSNSFAVKKTERVASAGATQTPSVVLNAAGSVKARVRYYSAFGQAAWSPFSNTVLLASSELAPPKPVSPEPEANEKRARWKSRLSCFLRVC